MDPRERLNDPQDAVRTAVRGALMGVWTQIPGIVTKVNLDPLTVEVQPTIKAVVEQQDGSFKAVDLPILLDVPVIFPSGGGLVLTFPVKPGDECLVKFSARCIDTWWQQGGVQLPNEARIHDLSDGFAEIGPFSQPRRFGGWSTTAAQLRTLDGQTYLEMHADNSLVRLVTPGNVQATVGGNMTANVSGDITATAGGNGSIDVGGTLEATAPGGATINANTTINGTLRVRDGVSAPTYRGLTGAGSGVAELDQAKVNTHLEVGGVTVEGHTHVDPQGGSVGPMV